jgi:hypothetical protein
VSVLTVPSFTCVSKLARHLAAACSQACFVGKPVFVSGAGLLGMLMTKVQLNNTSARGSRVFIWVSSVLRAPRALGTDILINTRRFGCSRLRKSAPSLRWCCEWTRNRKIQLNPTQPALHVPAQPSQAPIRAITEPSHSSLRLRECTPARVRHHAPTCALGDRAPTLPQDHIRRRFKRSTCYAYFDAER